MAKVNYETVIVLSTKQGEEGIKALVEKFQTLIAQNGTVDSVSYTHLDVYKRQISERHSMRRGGKRLLCFSRPHAFSITCLLYTSRWRTSVLGTEALTAYIESWSPP